MICCTGWISIDVALNSGTENGFINTFSGRVSFHLLVENVCVVEGGVGGGDLEGVVVLQLPHLVVLPVLPVLRPAVLLGGALGLLQQQLLDSDMDQIHTARHHH